MIWFVFKKASKPLKTKYAWLNYGLKPVLAISFAFNIGLITYLEINLFEYDNESLTSEEKDRLL